MKTSDELWRWIRRTKGVSQLVEKRFVPSEGDAIRLVVLNGVGEPGIGK
ncbi:MAG: hypothetical protein ACRDHB_10700 [Actinomycetota bacterium]